MLHLVLKLLSQKYQLQFASSNLQSIVCSKLPISMEIESTSHCQYFLDCDKFNANGNYIQVIANTFSTVTTGSKINTCIGSQILIQSPNLTKRVERSPLKSWLLTSRHPKALQNSLANSTKQNKCNKSQPKTPKNSLLVLVSFAF